MNRRFSVPSAQPPHFPKRRTQHLPDDFANFVPSGIARRTPSASPDLSPDISPSISIDTSALASAPLAAQPQPAPSQPEQISYTPTSPEPAFLNTTRLDPTPAPDASPKPPSAESQHNEIFPPSAPELSAPEEVLADEDTDESWAECQDPNSFLSNISRFLGPEAASDLTAVLRPHDSALFNPQFDSLSEMHYPHSSASSPQTCAQSNVAAAPNATSIPQNSTARKFQKTVRKQKVAGSATPSLSLHRRKCVICRHPEREMIEMYFIRWRSAHRIARDFDLSGTSVVYRHANALGLFAQRSRNIRSMLEVMFEQVANVTPTADALIRAVRTYASLSDHGEWIEPATTHVVTTSTVLPGLPAAARPNPNAVASNVPPPVEPETLPPAPSPFSTVSESLPPLPTVPSPPIVEIPVSPEGLEQPLEDPKTSRF